MPYQEILSRRIPYDIDGTEVGYNETVNYGEGITAWADSVLKRDMNSSTPEIIWSQYSAIHRCIWLFFPEAREIGAFNMFIEGYKDPTFYTFQGSNDTTNGIDGTWETVVFSAGTPDFSSFVTDWWRSRIKTVSFSSPKKVVRFSYYVYGTGTVRANSYGFQIYGTKTTGQTPDDILILDNDTAGTPEFTSLLDWGDRPEGTTLIKSFRLKNASATKTANSVNIQLNHADFAMSWNADGPWTTVLDIASLAPGAVSSPIYIRNQIGPPLQILGPKAARVIVGVGSWTT